MRIYTRLGDQGETSLYTPKGAAKRVAKNDVRVEAYGTIDELNALLGVVRSEIGPDADVDPLLRFVQNRLFHVGYDISTLAQQGEIPATVRPEDTKRLEDAIDRLQADLPALRQFILPAGDRPAALLQLARTVARRAERQVVSAQRYEEINPEAVRFLNRLSDLLFVLARFVNVRSGRAEETVDWSV